MGKVAIGYGNLVDTSTLSGGSWNVSYPLTELKTRELARYAQSSTSSPSDTQIILDHGSAKAAQCFGVFAHQSISAAATIQITRGTTSGASDVYNGDVLPCWPFTPLDYAGGHFGVFVIAGSESTARYTKIAISGSNVIAIGRIFVGPMFTPNYNPQYGDYADDWQDANSTVDRTENGADWVVTRTELRAAAFSYPALSHTKGSLMHEIVRTHSVTGEVVFVANTEDRARQQQYGFLGTMRKLSALEYPFFDHRSVAIGIVERGGAP